MTDNAYSHTMNMLYIYTDSMQGRIIRVTGVNPLESLPGYTPYTWLVVWCLECAEVNTSPLQFLKIRFFGYLSVSDVQSARLSGSVFMVSLAPAYLSDLCVPATAYCMLYQVVSICDLQRLALYNWFHAPGLQLDNEVSQSTDQPHRTVCTSPVTGPAGGCLQADTEDAPVLDRPAPLTLRRLHDSGAGYKYPDLLTYLLTYRKSP